MEHLPARSLSAGGYHRNDPLIIRGGHGTGEPTFTSDLISFNGDAVGGMYHETFYFEREFEPESWQTPDENGRYFSFCKTARKPYDLLVTAVLIRVKHHFPEIIVYSDGESRDWIEGLILVAEVFGSEAAAVAITYRYCVDK